MIDTSIQPSMRHVHRSFRIVIIAWVRSTLIERHNYIGTNGALNFHYIFGGKEMITSIDMRFKFYSFFFNFSVCRQRIHLITSAICEYISIPIHKFMNSPSFFQNGGLRTQIQMIGIPKDNVGVYFILQFALMHPFNGGNGTNRHKNRGFNSTMVEGDCTGSRLTIYILGF